MNKALLIFAREYTAKVKTKAFLAATFLGPLFFIGLIVVPIWLEKDNNQEVTIAVYDPGRALFPLLKSDDQIRFERTESSVKSTSELLSRPESVLEIPEHLDVFHSSGITLYFQDNKGGKLEGQVKDRINKALIAKRFTQAGISQNKVDSLQSEADIRTIVLDETGGGAADTTAVSVLGMVFGLMIYMFIFLYGSQVMRSVIEEKTSRIVEIIVTSVKPFQLLMGKILAVGAVGLTQFLIWVVVVNIVLAAFGLNASSRPGLNRPGMVKVEQPDVVKKADTQVEKPSLQASEETSVALRKLPSTIGWFLLFFLGGYLLYASMYGAVGSAVDQDGGETQQLVLPITAPLIISITVIGTIVNNPQSDLAFWMSMIPFTSPIIMMIRIPFGVPLWQILTSLGILFATFAGMLYFSAKIYRIGILSYGKRFTFKDLWNWARQA